MWSISVRKHTIFSRNPIKLAQGYNPKWISYTYQPVFNPFVSFPIWVTRCHTHTKRSTRLFVNPPRKQYFKKTEHPHASDSIITHIPLINQSDLLIWFHRESLTGCNGKAGCLQSVTGGFDKVTERLICLWCSLQPSGRKEPLFFRSYEIKEDFYSWQNFPWESEDAAITTRDSPPCIIHRLIMPHFIRLCNPSNNNVNFTSTKILNLVYPTVHILTCQSRDIDSY